MIAGTMPVEREIHRESVGTVQLCHTWRTECYVVMKAGIELTKINSLISDIYTFISISTCIYQLGNINTCKKGEEDTHKCA